MSGEEFNSQKFKDTVLWWSAQEWHKVDVRITWVEYSNPFRRIMVGAVVFDVGGGHIRDVAVDVNCVQKSQSEVIATLHNKLNLAYRAAKKWE